MCIQYINYINLLHNFMLYAVMSACKYKHTSLQTKCFNHFTAVVSCEVYVNTQPCNVALSAHTLYLFITDETLMSISMLTTTMFSSQLFVISDVMGCKSVQIYGHTNTYITYSILTQINTFYQNQVTAVKYIAR